MIVHTVPTSQRIFIKQQLGQRNTATVAALDDWLQGVRSGNYLCVKDGRDGMPRASSVHHVRSLKKKPPLQKRMEFRDMVKDMGMFHRMDRDAEIADLAEQLVAHCDHAPEGLQNVRALRDLVHRLRCATEARDDGRPDLPVQDESSSQHSQAGAAATNQAVPLEAQPPEMDEAREGPWANLEKRAQEQRAQIEAKLPAMGEPQQEQFAEQTAAELRKAIKQGRCDRDKLLAYYLKTRTRFSTGGETPWGAYQRLLQCVHQSRLLGLLPLESVGSFIKELREFRVWDHDMDVAQACTEWLDKARLWRQHYASTRRHGFDQQGDGFELERQVQSLRAREGMQNSSLLSLFLKSVCPENGWDPALAMSRLEAQMNNGLLGVLSEDDAQVLIREFAVAYVALKRNWPVEF